MVDLHCHLLPWVDDGPTDWDEAVEMARIAAADGVETAVATPHCQDGSPGPGEIRALVAELNRRLGAAGVALTVLPGAELNPQLPPETLRTLSLNATPYVLVEFPPFHLPANARDLVWRAVAQGLRPIIAHPERNSSVHRDPRRLLELLEAGALAQVTAASLEGAMGPEAEACARYLVRRGAVHFLASDGHSATVRRPTLSAGLAVAAGLLGAAPARRLVWDNPAAVVAGRLLDG